MLPEFVHCTSCQETLELSIDERNLGSFVCPACGFTNEDLSDLIEEFFTCTNCEAVLQLSSRERRERKFNCPACGKEYSLSSLSPLLQKVSHVFTQDEIFEVTHRGHGIKVVLDHHSPLLKQSSVMVFYNDKKVLEKEFSVKILSPLLSWVKVFEIGSFLVHEGEAKAKYSVSLTQFFDSATGFRCTIKRNGVVILKGSNRARTFALWIGWTLFALMILRFLLQL